MLTVHSREYEAYIKSPAWEAVRRQRLQIDGGKCVMCGRPVGAGVEWNTHHLHYRNLGHEDVIKDVCTLCRDCHEKIHNYYDRIGGIQSSRHTQRL